MTAALRTLVRGRPTAGAQDGAPGPAARSFLFLVVYIGGVFLAGALLAPWLYRAVAALSGPVPVIETLADHSFRRYVHRSILALALLGLWPFARTLGVRGWLDLGLTASIGATRMGAGLATGTGAIAAGTLLVLAAGGRTVTAGLAPATVLAVLTTAALSAAVVAVIEEVLFRGVLFGALRRAADWRAALAVTSLIYALVHFFGAPPSPSPITWSSGLAILPAMLAGFVRIDELVPACFTLFLAGTVLALSVQRTGGLGFAIGLHAGWVLWVRSYGVLTGPAPGVATPVWGSDIMIDGWLGLAVMSLTLLGVLAWLPQGSHELPRSRGDGH